MGMLNPTHSVLPSSRGIILVFLAPLPLQSSNGNPFHGDATYRGLKLLRFSTEIAVHLENGNTPMVTMDHMS